MNIFSVISGFCVVDLIEILVLTFLGVDLWKHKRKEEKRFNSNADTEMMAQDELREMIEKYKKKRKV
jgi:hypothetical protein